MNGFFGLLAGLVGIAGYGPYIRDILRRRTRPDRASWTIWALEYTGLFLTQLARGAAASLWLVGLQLLITLVVWALSIRYGIGNFNRRERIVLAAVCLTLVAWYFTKNASAAIIILVAVELSGVALTTYKVYKHPGSETLTMWLLLATAGALGIVAVGTGAAAVLYVYPCALILIGLSVTTGSLLGAQRLRATSHAATAPIGKADTAPSTD